jgi:hypothetical protein
VRPEIVWRNPVPPAKAESRIEAITVDEFGAGYVVSASRQNNGVRSDAGWHRMKLKRP